MSDHRQIIKDELASRTVINVSITPGIVGWQESKMQFQQTDFERERLLHVGVQQPLRLFERL